MIKELTAELFLFFSAADSEVRFSSAGDPVLDKEGSDKSGTAADLSTCEETRTISVNSKHNTKYHNVNKSPYTARQEKHR